MFTVTAYVAVELSAAVTTYETGFVKSFGVVPLTCTVDPTFTLAPVVENAATSAVTFVPNGTVTVIVFAFSLIVPVAAGLVNENAVMAFSLEREGLLSPPPPLQPANSMTIKTIIKKATQCFFIGVPSRD
jgi:hypothetical protein